MKKNIIITTLIFIVLIIAITFPLIFNFTLYIPGFFSSDENIAPLWDSWRLKYSLVHNLKFGSTNLISYPFGIGLYAGGYLSFLWIGTLYILSIFTSPVLSYNIQIIFNFFLNGIFTYILTLHITKNNLSALLGSIIFTFCPFQFARAWQHLSLTYTEWVPLSLFSLIFLEEKLSWHRTFLFLLSILLLFSFDYSIMYMGIVSLAVFFIYSSVIKKEDSRLNFSQFTHRKTAFFKKAFIAIALALTILSFQFGPIIRNRIRFSYARPASVFNPYRRPFENLFEQSAKPLSYFLPATVHPVFGKFTEQFIGSPLYGISFTEHTLYLGWIPLILAFVAIKRWRKMRKIGTVPFGDSPYHKEDFYIGFFIFLGVVAWLFSQPPWWNIFGFKIYMPSFFMYKILPMYRAYCRFGIVVMLAVAVLAGFGLKFILERFKSQKVKIAVTSLFCSLVLFEFWNWPPYKVIDVSKVPAVYYWLKAQPEDIVIGEYPLDADSPNEMYKFYQTKHEKKIINGAIPGTYANKVAQSIRKLSQPETARVLKWMGVKYVLVHRQDYIDTGLVDDTEELNKIPQNSGLKFIKTFPAQECPQKDIMCVQKTGPIDAYEVIAPSIEPVVKE